MPAACVLAAGASAPADSAQTHCDAGTNFQIALCPRTQWGSLILILDLGWPEPPHQMQPETDSSVFAKMGHLCLQKNENHRGYSLALDLQLGVVCLEIHSFNKHSGSNYCVSGTGLGTNSASVLRTLETATFLTMSPSSS